jgi:hypothetical protein
MQAALSDDMFVLKRYGRISGGKYRLYGLRQNRPLLYVEEEAADFPPVGLIHVYEDEEKKQEALTLVDSEALGVEIEVTDAESGANVGRIALAVDDAGDFIADTWLITDGTGKPVGKVLQKVGRRPVARAAPDAEPLQALDITIGGALVGELREKANVVGYELSLDFHMDAAHLLDRRLGFAMAILAALSRGRAA